MIIVEDRLQEIFNYLPQVNNFTPVFSHGDKKELNAFLKAKHKSDPPYPLIWLLYPYVENQKKRSVELNNVSFILAVTTNSTMQNKERLTQTYKKLLIPLYENIVKAFDLACIVNVEHEYKVVKHPNYSDDEQLGGSHGGTLIWDAIKMTFSIKINDACMRDIII